MRRKIVFSLLIFIASSSLSWAEEWSLDQALKQAIDQSPFIQEKRGELEKARGEKILRGTILPSNPEVEGEYTTDRFFANEGENTLSLGVNQEIEIAGQTWFRYRAAKLDYAKAKAEYDNALLTLTTEVETAYFKFLFQRKKKDLLDILSGQQKGIMDGAARGVDRGVIPRFDYDLLSAEHASLQALSIGAGSDLNEAALHFKELLGIPPDQEVVPVDKPLTHEALPERQAFWDEALQHHPLLEAAKYDLDARKNEKVLSALEFIPNPKARFAYSKEKTVLEDLHDEDKLYTFGLSFPIPLTGKNRGQFVRARGEKLAAQARQRASLLEIQKNLNDAYTRYQNLSQSVSEYAKVMERAEENINLLHKAYLQGRIPLDSFLVKRDRFINAGINYYDSSIELSKTKAQLERALGKRLAQGTTKGSKP